MFAKLAICFVLVAAVWAKPGVPSHQGPQAFHRPQGLPIHPVLPSHPVQPTHPVHSGHHVGSEHEAGIISKNVDIHPDGSYQYSYETSDGIKAQAVGEVKQFDKDVIGVVHGDFSWTAPDGEQVAIQYVADENGYQPTGTHIHPIPPQIQRALDYLATAPTPQEYVQKSLRIN